MRIISDVHGDFRSYYKLIAGTEYSLQLGDFGFDYNVLSGVDPAKHRMIAGNHDNHDETHKWRHFLPKYGVSQHGGFEFFHMQGAFSINWREMVRDELLLCTKRYWRNEELSLPELDAAYKSYCDAKPNLVFTHEAPRSVVNDFFSESSHILRRFGFDPDRFTTNTSEALQAMFEFHQPKHWFFGHYHTTKQKVINGTSFQCLAILEHMDI